jgi:antitoxin (DNA-binding transcriptional repressor) of toxin-antitoxin stability system
MSRRVAGSRELRNECRRVRRAVDKGKSFAFIRNGVPVAELAPLRRRAFVASDIVLAAFGGAPLIAHARFRKDIDAVIDQDATPRG